MKSNEEEGKKITSLRLFASKTEPGWPASLELIGGKGDEKLFGNRGKFDGKDGEKLNGPELELEAELGFEEGTIPKEPCATIKKIVIIIIKKE